MKEMKKICALIVAVLLLQLTAVFAFAGGGFTSSPELAPAPGLEGEVEKHENCVADIKIYAYGDRNQLKKSFATIMEDAYNKISGTADLGEIGESVGELADELKVDSSVLVASELFAVVSEGCYGHKSHGTVGIEIKPIITENFAGLLAYDGNEWSIVESEVKDGVILFDHAGDAVYTILLHDGTAKEPANGAVIAACGGAAVVAAGGIVAVVLLKKKKQEA